MNHKNMKKIVLGGGCFWCLEAVFLRVRGVVSVQSGYAGGAMENPTYEDVSRGDTGHAEVVEVLYNESEISLSNILDIFFSLHDPTTLNRQGNDTGTQYRSIVFVETDSDRLFVLEKISELEREKIFSDPIVTEVRLLARLYPAESYHNRYYEKNTAVPYCEIVINPKLAKLRKKFEDFLIPSEKS